MELSAVVDISPEAARIFGNDFDCPSYTSLDAYMSGNDFTGCSVLCTPASRNADIAMRLMQRGAGVLCEKPFALDAAAAEKLMETARRRGVQLMPGSRFRYITDIIHARGLIQSGILGRILVFEIDLRGFADADEGTESIPDEGARAVLMDWGGHAVDIARYFFGPLLRIRAEEAQKSREYNFGDTVSLDMRTVSGAVGTAQLGRTAKNPREDYVRIYGNRGTLCIGRENSVYRLNGFADWTRFGEGYDTLKAVTRQMENLLHAVKKDQIPETTAEDGCESVRVLEAAGKSLATDQWIKLAPDPTPCRIERKFKVLRPA
jgi:predicted dehydrogenase